MKITMMMLSRIFRKKSTLFSLLLLPILATFLAILFNISSEQQVNVGIIDSNQTFISKKIKENLKENKNFNVSEDIQMGDADELLKNKTFEVIVIISEDFSEHIINGKNKSLELRYISNSEIIPWIESQLKYDIDNLLIIGQVANGDGSIFQKVLSNIESMDYGVKIENVQDLSVSKAVSSQGLGFLIVTMLAFSSFLSITIISEKEKKIFDRILITKSSVIKYILSYLMVGFITYLIQFSIMSLLFSLLNIKLYVPASVLYITLLLLTLLISSFAILVGAFSKNVLEGVKLLNLTILPSSMLAGCFWPISITPNFMQILGKIFPQNWILTIIEIAQNGGSVDKILVYQVLLLLVSIFFLLISYYKMSSRENF
ncbi:MULTISPECIES: ABC transporter permease [unclassified Gemella]|uniref:ABC transporter permease n=1 Tax=unclassified Gemella TaxID=2624949 RepID=UPI00107449FF|nr:MULTISPECIES: ABC transporter permease [unclassified Gemella]MBF0710728.1 ABC transporter permease [Gemella sp. GL1.1]MBF0746703.1 ABC transporter permease [Gemella sp. 19428wG2_WT2a]NYS28072.1 ABC transporter permease [Gemella sp. GL1]TFU60052.1 ABC transporter permease [Gemella sp. WT2a]